MALQSIGSIIHDHALAQGAALAVSYPDGALSWNELDRRANRLARALQAQGVEADDLVAVTLPNGSAFHCATVAIWKAGATPCVLSSRLPARELLDVLAVARPRAVIGEVPAEVDAVRLGPEADGFDDGPLPNLAPTYWKAVASGGSTGRPKVIVDHAPGRFDPAAMPVAVMGLLADSVVLNPGPLYHNGPFSFSSLALISGARVVGMERFDAETCLRLIEAERVTWVCFVPTMMQRIWALPAEVRARYDLSSLRFVWHLAAPCPVWLKRAWIDWLGPERIFEAYAGTESAATAITGAQWLNKPGSVGQAPQGALRVLREDGSECAPGEVGEIHLPARSAEQFHYIGAELNMDAARGLSIGDLGHLDEDGYLFLADRRSDLILRGGANIYPAEVESVLDEHPDILSSAVLGLPSGDLGQEVHAVVQRRPGVTLDLGAVDAFVQTRLAGYKRPRSYEVVDEPLRDDAGKIRRSKLRDERIAARS